MVRLSALARQDEPCVPSDLELTPDVLAFLSAVASDPVIREAIAVSSISLDGALDKIVAGGTVEPKRLRGAALSAARYLARISCRPTPFGLLAGVAPARFGAITKVRFGAGHRKRVWPDTGWLIRLVRGWETDDAVVPRLRLVVNDLCFVRGDRLVLPYLPAPDDELAPDGRERTVRNTAAVRAVVVAARTPIGHSDLVDRLVHGFPQASRAVADRMVRQLIEQDFLLTDLRPPATADDPVRYVLDRLDPGFPGYQALAKILAMMERYAAAPAGTVHGLAAWRSVLDTVRQWDNRLTADYGNRGRPGNPLHVDLRIDADIVLPSEVARELERAAQVAWRIAAPRLAPIGILTDYHAEFLERYGAGALVPAKELLDPGRGLGPPAGYQQPPGERPAGRLAPEAAERDAVLFDLVQQASVRGEREILLDDATVGRLARHGGAQGGYIDGAQGGYVEACAEVLARSEETLGNGDFRLALDSGSSQSRVGALVGRFLPLVPELAEPLAGLAAELIGPDGDDPVPAQLTHVLMQLRSGNLNRIPRLTENAVEVGVYSDRSRPENCGLDELLVGADHDEFFLVSARTSREIVPLSFSALNPDLCLPNAARLLAEIGLARFRPWVTWHWGQVARLTYLPRVRYGRTVLTPARWRPSAELRDAALGWKCWRQRWEEWRADWDVPATIRVGALDAQMTLELANDTHLRLLRAELARSAGAVLTEEPMGGEYGTGWADGRAVQLVVPLRPRGHRRRPTSAIRHMRPRNVAARSPQHRPGGEWLYAKVYAPQARHNEILARCLPELLTAAAPFTDRWFFVRYRDHHAHLRLRFHGEPANLNSHLLPLVHRWADALAAAGLSRDIILDSYRPEVVRYGGVAAFQDAERVFCADSISVLEQLALRADGKLDLPMELLAAVNVIDLAARLDPDGWQHWLPRNYPKGPGHEAFRRVRAQAMKIGDPRDGWSRLRTLPGGTQLVQNWHRRATAVRKFGDRIRQQDPRAASSHSDVFASLLHMNHNRLAGIDAASETAAYAIARGIVQVIADRERHHTQCRVGFEEV